MRTYRIYFGLGQLFRCSLGKSLSQEIEEGRDPRAQETPRRVERPKRDLGILDVSLVHQGADGEIVAHQRDRKARSPDACPHRVANHDEGRQDKDGIDPDLRGPFGGHDVPGLWTCPSSNYPCHILNEVVVPRYRSNLLEEPISGRQPPAAHISREKFKVSILVGHKLIPKPVLEPFCLCQHSGRDGGSSAILWQKFMPVPDGRHRKRIP